MVQPGFIFYANKYKKRPLFVLYALKLYDDLLGTLGRDTVEGEGEVPFCAFSISSFCFWIISLTFWILNLLSQIGIL